MCSRVVFNQNNTLKKKKKSCTLYNMFVRGPQMLHSNYLPLLNLISSVVKAGRHNPFSMTFMNDRIYRKTWSWYSDLLHLYLKDLHVMLLLWRCAVTNGVFKLDLTAQALMKRLLCCCCVAPQLGKWIHRRKSSLTYKEKKKKLGDSYSVCRRPLTSDQAVKRVWSCKCK